MFVMFVRSLPATLTVLSCALIAGIAAAWVDVDFMGFVTRVTRGYRHSNILQCNITLSMVSSRRIQLQETTFFSDSSYSGFQFETVVIVGRRIRVLNRCKVVVVVIRSFGKEW